MYMFTDPKFPPVRMVPEFTTQSPPKAYDHR